MNSFQNFCKCSNWQISCFCECQYRLVYGCTSAGETELLSALVWRVVVEGGGDVPQLCWPQGPVGGRAATVLPPVSHGAGQPCGGDPSHAAGAAGLWPAPSRTSSVIISKLLLHLSPELFIFKMGVSRERWPHPECVSAQHELCFAGALWRLHVPCQLLSS